MNKLQLVQRLFQEAAISGSQPTTTLSQSGMSKRCVDWIDSAYQDIQDRHENWDFLRGNFSFQTNTTSRQYTKSAISLTGLNAWKVDDVRSYADVNNETEITFMPWDSFKKQYILGPSRLTTARPFYFSIDQYGDFWTDYIPNDVYTINGEYFKIPDEMTSDTAIPLIPSQFQLSIVWRSLMFYGAYDGASDAYTHGEKEFNRIMFRLETNQLPKKSLLGGPLV